MKVITKNTNAIFNNIFNNIRLFNHIVLNIDYFNKNHIPVIVLFYKFLISNKEYDNFINWINNNI